MVALCAFHSPARTHTLSPSREESLRTLARELAMESTIWGTGTVWYLFEVPVYRYGTANQIARKKLLRNVHDTSQYFLQQPFIGIFYQRCFLARYSVVLFVLLRRGWPTLPAYCQRILAPATRSGIAAWAAAAKVYCWLIPIFFGVRSRMMASLFQMPLQPTTPVTQHITRVVSWSVLHSSYTKR